MSLSQTIRRTRSLLAGAVTLLVASAAGSAAQGPTPASISRTRLDSLIPAFPAHFIADQTGVLGEPREAEVAARIRAVHAATGGDIFVAIIPDLRDYPPYEVGTAIYRAWKVGSQAAIGNAHRAVGALILIVPKEKNPRARGTCFITPGRGAEGYLTDVTAATICRDSILPRLRTRDYAGGLMAGVGALDALMRAGLAADSSALAAAAPPAPAALRGNAAHDSLLWETLGLIALLIGGMYALIRAAQRNKAPARSADEPHGASRYAARRLRARRRARGNSSDGDFAPGSSAGRSSDSSSGSSDRGDFGGSSSADSSGGSGDASGGGGGADY